MRSAASRIHREISRARRVAALLAAVVTLAGVKARAEVVPLAELERRALAHRASLAAARARVTAAEARAVSARAARYPTATATLSGELAPGSRLIRVRDLKGDEYLTTGSRALGDEGVLTPDLRHETLVTVQARLLDFGRTSASIRVADAGIEAAAAEARLEERAVALDVRLAYLAWLHAFGSRRLLAEVAGASRALREVAEARVEEGSARSRAVASARLEEIRARLSLERAGAELARARAGLERAATTRLPANAEPEATLLAISAAAPSPIDPEARALEQRRSALKAAAAGRRATRYPIVSLSAEAGLRGQAATLFPLYRVGLAVTIPIFDGSAASAAATLAEAQASELVAAATEARARAQAQRAEALVASEHAEREVAIAEELAREADRIVKRVEEEHALGEVDREQLIQARLERSHARLELLAARVERARAILFLGSGAAR